MNECIICKKPASWTRCTQFAGDHPFCEEHARAEAGFGENDSYEFWKQNVISGANQQEDDTIPYEISTHEKQAEFAAKRNYEWNGVAPSVNQQYKVTYEWDNWKPIE